MEWIVPKINEIHHLDDDQLVTIGFCTLMGNRGKVS